MNVSNLIANNRNVYLIHHHGLFLDITLLETKSIHVHEEIIPIRYNELKEAIEQDGFQSSPVLVDRKALVVIDGVHRKAIMTDLGAKFICVCLLDYFNPGIKIQRWCRLISGPFTEKIVRDSLRSLGFSLEPYEIVDRIEDVKEPLLKFRESIYRIVSYQSDLIEIFKKIYNLELMLLENKYEIRYCTESEADGYLATGKYEAVLYPPKLEKQKVLDAATNNKVFTPKATRHTLPARPVAVNAPLSLLRNKEISLEEANKRFAQIHNIKHVKRYDVGALWMGKRHKEVLYNFSEPHTLSGTSSEQRVCMRAGSNLDKNRHVH
jgi:hypothetical protein